MGNCVLAIDPGTSKCGIAVVCENFSVPWRGIVPTSEILETAIGLISQFDPRVVVIGSGTGSTNIVELLKQRVRIPIKAVSEEHTSEQARKRWFLDHPPKGLKRLIPVSLLTPDGDIDDYAAIILAENFLCEKA